MKKHITKVIAVVLTLIIVIGLIPPMAMFAETSFAGAVSAGTNHTMMIKTNGELWGWGYNDYGQLGDGTTATQTSPKKIMDNVSAVSAGEYYTMAVKTNGELWSWGYNNLGQLGDGTNTSRTSPKKIMDNVSTFSAGRYHTMAVKTNGELWGWGSNFDGGLGDGTYTSRTSPKKIIDSVSVVSAGYDYTMAVKTNGELWGWGDNDYGQLGDGTTTGKTSPKKVMDNVSAISAGYNHTMAVKTNGELWGWGDNDYGQLGDGTTTIQKSPIKIMDNVSAISAGYYYTMAVKTNGELWGWGYSASGQLVEDPCRPMLIGNVDMPRAPSAPASGTYPSGVEVILTCTTEGANIYYTIDGSTPTAASVKYTHPFMVDRTTTLKIVAVKNGDYSDIVTYTYTIKPQVTADVITGVYSDVQFVTLTSSISSYSIYYTLDGSTPGVSSVSYTGEIEIYKSCTLKAIAIKDDSSGSVSSYTYTLPVAKVEADKPVGTYNAPMKVTLTGKPSWYDEIYYTLDGSTPTTSSARYGSPISVDKTMTVKAIAVKNGDVSEVADFAYTISPAVTANYESGTYSDMLNVTLDSTMPGYDVYFTIDGSTPTAAGMKYMAPIEINKSTVLKAVPYKSGVYGTVTTFDYNLPTAGVSADHQSGTYSEDITVELTAIPWWYSNIYYTLDGTTPTIFSTQYSGPITLSKNTTIKAISVFGSNISGVSSYTYNFAPQVKTNVEPGSYAQTQEVTLSADLSGCEIYYTTDGSTPTVSSTRYTAPISIYKSCTLKAIAIKSDTSSVVSSFSYYLSTITAWANVPSGSYNTPQTVSMFCSLTGYDIYYTINGDAPTVNSIKYEGPITVSRTSVIKIIAHKNGMSSSYVTYEYLFPTVTVSADKPTGTYSEPFEVALNSSTDGSEIYYTIDGSIPTEQSIEYIAPVTISETTVLKAIAVKDGVTSNVAEYTYTFAAAAEAVKANPSGGGVVSGTAVTLSTGTAGAIIRYTIDGTEPTMESAAYITPIVITVDTIIKAKAFKDGIPASGVSVFAYNIMLQVSNVEASPEDGTITSGDSIILSCATPDAVIRYTTDGSTPTASSMVYSSPVVLTSSVAASRTIKAKAFKNGMTDSDIAVFTYAVMPKVAAVTASPSGGNILSGTTITLYTPTSGAVIRYTTDGTEPSVLSAAYSGPIALNSTVNVNKTLKARAFKQNMIDSDISVFEYTVTQKAAAVTADPSGGVILSGTVITLSTTTPDAVVYYTMDGTDPTEFSDIYSGPVMVSSENVRNLTFKAKAVRNDMYDSDISTFVYTVAPHGVPLITIGDVTGKPGQEIDVPVHISGNPGIASFMLNLNFDRTKLTPVSITKGDALPSGSFLSNIMGSVVDLPSLNLVSAQYINAVNSTNNGILFTVRFKIKENVSVETTGLSVTYNQGEIIDQNTSEIYVATMPNDVTIVTYTPGDINEDGVINVKDSLMLAQYIVGSFGITLSTNQRKAADVYKDGTINIKDALKLAQYHAGWPNIILGTK